MEVDNAILLVGNYYWTKVKQNFGEWNRFKDQKIGVVLTYANTAFGLVLVENTFSNMMEECQGIVDVSKFRT